MKENVEQFQCLCRAKKSCRGGNTDGLPEDPYVWRLVDKLVFFTLIKCRSDAISQGTNYCESCYNNNKVQNMK